VKQDMQLLSLVEDARIETIQSLKKTQEMGQKVGSFAAPADPPPTRIKDKDA